MKGLQRTNPTNDCDRAVANVGAAGHFRAKRVVARASMRVF